MWGDQELDRQSCAWLGEPAGVCSSYRRCRCLGSAAELAAGDDG
jgi:hypothetical protein